VGTFIPNKLQITFYKHCLKL